MGRLIKSAFNVCTYSFSTIPKSLKAALQIREAIEYHIRREAGKMLKVKIGIAFSPSIEPDSDFLEEACRLAWSLCFAAGINQIVISAQIKEQFYSQNLEARLEDKNLKLLNYKSEQCLAQVMKIIEDRYKEDLKIGHFCLRIGESRSQFYRKILEVTGLPPVELVKEFRLQKAIELMNRRQDRNISEIAYESGFNSLSYFSRQFKNRYGLLPSAYKCSTT